MFTTFASDASFIPTADVYASAAVAQAKRERQAGTKTFRADQTIQVLVSNPKKPGTAGYARFALYVNGMTVAQAKAAGVWAADLQWDIKRNFISIQ